MKIQIMNLGPIKEASFEPSDFTIVCGPNNSGKTHLSYFFYGLLRRIVDDFRLKTIGRIYEQLQEKRQVVILFDELFNDCKESVDEIFRSYVDSVGGVFGVNKEFFRGFECCFSDFDRSALSKLSVDDKFSVGNCQLKIVKEEGENEIVVDILSGVVPVGEDEKKLFIDDLKILSSLFVFQDWFVVPYVAPAERGAIALYQREIDGYRLNEIENIVKKIRDNPDDKQNVLSMLTRIPMYALPVLEHSNFIRHIPNIKTNVNLVKDNKILNALNELIGGRFSVSDDNIDFEFADGESEFKIPLRLSSSLSQNLIYLYYYINYAVSTNQALFIDEPEISLHPDNQRRIARLFALLVNSGVKVFITTHSDYFLKEISMLVMLGKKFKKRSSVMKKFGVTQAHVLSPEKVKVYLVDQGTLLAQQVSVENGIAMDGFDRAINSMNEMYDSIVFHSNDV